ncbi:MAG: FapA family protein [Oscillospiraceae bacterium]|jgi:uncharacterized protein (DUF342 family)|nr:FapA family protein [Oscillospiraceae bacterium]
MNDAENTAEVLTQELPTKPNMLVSIIRDGNEAEIIIQRTGQNTQNPLMEDLAAALSEKGVTAGIKEDLLREMTVAPVYNQSITVAAGTKPTVGADGSLRYLIKTDLTLRPALREDGTADYKDLGFINTVEAGQRLVEIVPPAIGAEGFDVRGNILPGLPGKAAAPPKGQGTEVAEDGAFLLAAVTGHAETDRRGIVIVKEVIKVKNVDNSTGDLIFPGDILIQGDVAAGFNVRSTNGSIIVKGTVDAATLEAKGDITIGDGVMGQDRAVIYARGNVKCRFLQNCAVKAEGNIYADTIMYCELECDGDVELTGKRAAIIGGNSYIAGMLNCKGLGTEAHTATYIKMCAASMGQKRELDGLNAEVARIDGEIAKIVQILNRFDELQKQNRLTAEHVRTVSTVKDNYRGLNEQRIKAAERIAELQKGAVNAHAQSSFIICAGRVHSGVKVVFGPLVLNVTDSFANSRILIIDGDIRVTAI